MKKTPRSDIGQLIKALVNQVILGSTHLAILNGLNDADPVVLGTGSVFFGLTIRAHLEAGQMYAAKLFDTHRDAQTVHTLLASAEQNTHRFKNTSPREVHAAVRAARQRIEGLQPVMKSIRTRRNKMLAHLSPEAVRDPVKVGRDARLTRADLSKLFNVAHEIINEISLLYMNTTHLRSFPFEEVQPGHMGYTTYRLHR